jgi:hypothetical protein
MTATTARSKLVPLVRTSSRAAAVFQEEIAVLRRVISFSNLSWTDRAMAAVEIFLTMLGTRREALYEFHLSSYC